MLAWKLNGGSKGRMQAQHTGCMLNRQDATPMKTTRDAGNRTSDLRLRDAGSKSKVLGQKLRHELKK